MRLLIYDTEMQTANAYIPNSIATAASKLLGASNVHLCSHYDVVKYAASGAWDGLLAIGGAGADRHILTALMRIPIIRILWTTEDPYERRLIQRVEPAFHFIFSNEQSCDGSNSQTSFLPLAAEPDLHFRKLIKSDDEYEFDLTFVGTAWPNRVASLERTISFLPDNIKVFLCQIAWTSSYVFHGIVISPSQGLKPSMSYRSFDWTSLTFAIFGTDLELFSRLVEIFPLQKPARNKFKVSHHHREFTKQL